MLGYNHLWWANTYREALLKQTLGDAVVISDDIRSVVTWTSSSTDSSLPRSSLHVWFCLREHSWTGEGLSCKNLILVMCFLCDWSEAQQCHDNWTSQVLMFWGSDLQNKTNVFGWFYHCSGICRQCSNTDSGADVWLTMVSSSWPVRWYCFNKILLHLKSTYLAIFPDLHYKSTFMSGEKTRKPWGD